MDGTTARRPLIGICSWPLDDKPDLSCVNTHYLRAIQKAGGIPVALPFGFESAAIAPEIMEHVDGLLLTGGGDVSEEGFGGNNYDEGCVARIKLMSADRDVFEWAAVRAIWNQNKPCLGICRGMQVMNVSFGGTLLRDIETRQPSTTVKHEQKEPMNTPSHCVRIEAASWLAQILGGLEFEVNSMHHQAIAVPANKSRIVAWAPDGVPEAIEFSEKHFFIGVQWHPERLESMTQLFEAFVDAARTNG
ncbi:MAG: gamma-glutamyl-gamma-aminobutyrate hydrolase family protein [Atopobiaceae bacterium]|nr:gamma-glutamyl-gamma-aminobutyrate hydrolase family protein [Atopobiaceae bacterium]